MNTITNITAAEINRLHDLAKTSADAAFGYAVEAGKLLLQMKGQLGHGKFGRWVAEYLTVSVRQAQRYIAAAEGKPVPIRAKANATPVSHSEVDAPRNLPGSPTSAPGFVPDAKLAYICQTRAEGVIYIIEPSVKWPGFFFVSRLNEDDTHDYTCRPVGAEWVEEILRLYDLGSAVHAEWRVRSCAGVLRALDSLGRETTPRTDPSNPPKSGRIERPQNLMHLAAEGGRP